MYLIGHIEIRMKNGCPAVAAGCVGGAVIVELVETGHIVDTGVVASAREQAAVAELMEPSKRLLADPPLYAPPAATELHLLLSPGEPDDESDDK